VVVIRGDGFETISSLVFASIGKGGGDWQTLRGFEGLWIKVLERVRRKGKDGKGRALLSNHLAMAFVTVVDFS